MTSFGGYFLPNFTEVSFCNSIKTSQHRTSKRFFTDNMGRRNTGMFVNGITENMGKRNTGMFVNGIAENMGKRNTGMFVNGITDNKGRRKEYRHVCQWPH